MAATSTQQGTSGNPFGDYLQFVSNALRSRNNAGFASSSPWPDDGLHFVPDTDPVSAAYGPHGGSSYAATSTGASTSDPGFNLLWPASADSPVGGATYSQGASSYVNNPGPLSSAQWPDDGLGFVTDASNGLGLIRDNAPPSISISISGTGPIANAPAGAGISGDSAFNRLTPADWGAASSATTVPQNSDQLGAQNYQGQQAAAASLAAAFANPYYQSGNPPVAGGQLAGLQVPQMSQWNPTLGDDVRQVWNDIRTSQPVESIFGRTPDETAQMWEPRPTGLLPNTDKALQDWQVVGSYSPADLLPAPQTVSQGITTAVLRQANLNNVLMATGVGEVLKMLSLAKDAPQAVAMTKAFLAAYAASNGAKVVGQSAGDVAGNPNLPPGQKGADLGNIGLGLLSMLGGVYTGTGLGQPDNDGQGATPPTPKAPSRVVNFEGMKVRAVRDLSNLTDAQLEAMQNNGGAGTTVNGIEIQLHHLRQNAAGPVVEIPRIYHSIGNKIQHPFGNTPGAGLTDEQRANFDDWRDEYWKWRATQELDTRRMLGDYSR